MGQRIGFGATLASAVLFSALLISNLAIVIGSEQRERLIAEADAETYLYDKAQVMVASEGLALLEQEQALVSSRVFPCPGLPDAVAIDTGRIQASQTDGNLVVNASLSFERDPSMTDNAGIFQPYNGSVQGNLNLVLSSSASTTVSSLGVGLEMLNVHHLALPVKLDAIESFCRDSVGSINSDLLAGVGKGCNSTEIAATMSGETESLERAAEALGLNLRVSYSLFDGQVCEVSFVLDISQRGIVGPGGPFTMRAEGEGLALLQA